MTSFITYSIETLTIDGVTSFLQLLDVQKMYVKIRVSVLTRVAGNSDSLFKMAESLYTVKDSFIFSFRVLESK